MTNKDESKYSMELTVRDLLNQNAPITSSLPSYGVLFASYTANLNQIQIIRQQQEVDKTGIAENKEILRTDLILKALDVSRKTEAYAKITNNAILAKEVHYSESDLNKSADTILKDRALLIHDKANANLSALSTYGITATVLTALKNAIDLYNAAIPKPRLGITEKKQATEQLANLIKANDDILKRLDMIVEVVRLSQPVFYAGYKTARKIVETGIGKLAVKGAVSDASTGNPIKGVTVTLSLDGKAATTKQVAPIVKRTAEKGGFSIKSLPAGIYNVVVTKNGYLKQEATLAVTEREMSVLNIKLSKN